MCSICLCHSCKHFCKSNVRAPSTKQGSSSTSVVDDDLRDSQDSTDDDMMDISHFVSGFQEDLSDDGDRAENEEIVIVCNAQDHEVDLLDKILQSLKQIQKLSWHDFSPDKKHKLAEIGLQLGKIIELDLYNDGLQATKECGDITEPICKLQWLNRRNPMFVGFITGCTKTSPIHEVPDKKLVLLCML